MLAEFIGITLALSYLGVSQFWGVLASAVIVMAAVSTGDFRRFERFGIVLVVGSLLLVPVILFQAENEFGVMVSSEYDGEQDAILHEYDPWTPAH